MRGRAACIACIVAASALQLASLSAQPPLVPATFELPVTGGEPTLERLGIEPEERAVGLPLLARALHGAAAVNTSGSLAVTFTEIFGAVTTTVSTTVAAGPPAVVLAPFSDEFWRRVLSLDRDADLFAAIVKQRGALLVASGAMYCDRNTREWLQGQASLTAEIVKSWPGAFAVASPGLAMADGDITVPGGRDGVAAWTSLVGASPADPARFLRRLLDRDDGRLARFFATVRQLDDRTRESLLEPLRGETPTAALENLYNAARRAEPVWAPNVHPYQLTNADLPSVLRGLPDAATLPPAAGWWPLLLDGVNSRRDAADMLARPSAAPAYAATVRAVLDGSYRERRDRLTTIALARRAWPSSADPGEQADLVYALSQFARYRALLLTLDRIDVLSPGTWALSIDAARRVDCEA